MKNVIVCDGSGYMERVYHYPTAIRTRNNETAIKDNHENMNMEIERNKSIKEGVYGFDRQYSIKYFEVE